MIEPQSWSHFSSHLHASSESATRTKALAAFPTSRRWFTYFVEFSITTLAPISIETSTTVYLLIVAMICLAKVTATVFTNYLLAFPPTGGVNILVKDKLFTTRTFLLGIESSHSTIKTIGTKGLWFIIVVVDDVHVAGTKGLWFIIVVVDDVHIAVIAIF